MEYPLHHVYRRLSIYPIPFLTPARMTGHDRRRIRTFGAADCHRKWMVVVSAELRFALVYRLRLFAALRFFVLSLLRDARREADVLRQAAAAEQGGLRKPRQHSPIRERRNILLSVYFNRTKHERET